MLLSQNSAARQFVQGLNPWTKSLIGGSLLIVMFCWAMPARADSWLYRQDSSAGSELRASSLGTQSVPGLPGVRRFDDERITAWLSPSERASVQLIRAYQASFTPNDPQFSLQWNFPLMNVPAAWDTDQTVPLYGGDPNVMVAVIDTGVAFETYQSFTAAPDFAGTTFWTNPNETAGDSIDNDGNGLIDDLHGWDFVNNDAHPNDDNGHGTHVTATIAETTDNNLSVAGIAWRSTILPLKTLDASGSGTTDTFAAAIQYAVDQGADIINLSLGGSDPDPILEAIIEEALSRGVIIIAAAGNDGTNVIDYPARYAGVIAVGAVQVDSTRTGYSNYGPELDVVAPGGNLALDQNNDGQPDGIAQQTCTSGACSAFDTFYYSGTSQATAHVAAVAALVAACGTASGSVTGVLQNSATDLGAAGRDDEYGYGLVQAAAALSTAGCTSAPPAPPLPPGTITGRSSSTTQGIVYSHHVYPYTRPLFTWTGPAGATYQVQWGKSGQTPVLTTQTATSYSPKPSSEGTYLLSVNTVDALGQTSSAETFTYRFRQPVLVISQGSAVRLYRTTAALIRSLAGGFGSVNVQATGGVLETDDTNRLVTVGRAGSRSLKVMNTQGSVLRNQTPFGSTFSGALDAAVLDSTGEPRLAVSTATAGASIRWYLPNGTTLLARQLLYQTYRGGLRLASGDLNGDGHDELIVAQTKGPEVRVYDRDQVRLAVFKPLGPSYQGGWQVTSGDWEGDGRDEIVLIPGTGSASMPVFVTTLRGVVKKVWRLKIANNTSSVDIEAVDVDGNGKDELLALPAGAPLVVYQWSIGGLSPKTIKLSTTLRDGLISSLR